MLLLTQVLPSQGQEDHRCSAAREAVQDGVQPQSKLRAERGDRHGHPIAHQVGAQHPSLQAGSAGGVRGDHGTRAEDRLEVAVGRQLRQLGLLHLPERPDVLHRNGLCRLLRMIFFTFNVNKQAILPFRVLII